MTYFPDCNTCIWIFYRRDSSIGVDGEEWLLFEFAPFQIFAFVRQSKFFEYDRDFWWVGTSPGIRVQFDRLSVCHGCE